MKIEIVPYTREYENEVRNFNSRLRAKDSPFRFPDNHIPQWLPEHKSRRVYQQFSLALDEQSMVRGAYILKHQEFLLNGTVRRVADYHLPISEAIVDPKYNCVGLKLLADATRKQPLLFALGMGGYQQPLPRMLNAARWSIAPLPFFFRVVRPRAFFKNIAALRTTPFRRLACDLMAVTGLGRLVVQATRVIRPAARRPKSVALEKVDEFSHWADEVWRACKDQYALIAVRDKDVLNVLYPPGHKRFIRLKVVREGKPIGWAVLLVTPMSGHKQFGNMKVGTLVDCLAEPTHAISVVACAREVLESRGADLVVSNQAHAAWCEALRACGFLEGPSNFLFAASPKLASNFQPFIEKRGLFHLNRGDGDGPIHL